MIGRIKAAVVRSQVEQDMVRMTSRLASAPEQEEVLAILTLRSRLGEITIHHNDGHEHFAELSVEFGLIHRIFGIDDDSPADLKQLAIILRVRSLCCGALSRDWGALELSQFYYELMVSEDVGLYFTLVGLQRARKLYPSSWFDAVRGGIVGVQHCPPMCPPPALLQSVVARMATSSSYVVRRLRLLLSDDDDMNAAFFKVLPRCVPRLEELTIVRSHTINPAVRSAISRAIDDLPNLRHLELYKVVTHDQPPIRLRRFIAYHHPSLEVLAYHDPQVPDS